jgi:hypothetical protein
MTLTANATYILNPRVKITERVHLHDVRGGFAYIQFLTPNGYVTKVPESWVVAD